jgi:hypothetical protein
VSEANPGLFSAGPPGLDSFFFAGFSTEQTIQITDSLFLLWLPRAGSLQWQMEIGKW